MIKPGDKVRCIDATPHEGGHDPLGLTLGAIYPITEVNPTIIGGTHYGVRVGGWHAPSLSGFYKSTRFEPVQERATDISVFTAILDGKKQKKSVRKPRETSGV